MKNDEAQEGRLRFIIQYFPGKEQAREKANIFPILEESGLLPLRYLVYNKHRMRNIP